MKDSEGGVEVSETNNSEDSRVIVTMVVPMLHYLPEDSHAMEKISESITKANLTNSRTIVNLNKLVWKKEVLAETNDTKAEDDSGDMSGENNYGLD